MKLVNKEKILKNEKGITLIALVVTIVILIILATVTINVAISKNGIVDSTLIAEEKTEIANLIELAKLDLIGVQIQNQGNITKEQFVEILKIYFRQEEVPKAEDLPEDLSTLVLTAKEEYKSHKIKASEIYQGKFKNTDLEINTDLVINIGDYGKKVNYISKGDSSLIWRLFYDDEDYVYLISSKADGSNTLNWSSTDIPADKKNKNSRRYYSRAKIFKSSMV